MRLQALSLSCLFALSLDRQLLNAMHVVLTQHPTGRDAGRMSFDCHLFVTLECLFDNSEYTCR
jgi:hypothetical protein